MNKFTRLTLGISAIFFILVILLSFSGTLTFGHGIGDMAYILFLIFWTLAIGAIYKYTKRVDFNSRKSLSVLIVFVLFLSVFYTVDQFTFDRGPEFRWDGHILLSVAKADHLKQTEQGYENEIQQFDSLTASNPSDFKSFYEKGLLFRHQGEWQKSISEYERAIKINPNYFDAYFECAYSYCNIQQYGKALELYQKASEIDTTNIRVKNIIKNLKEYHHL